MDTAGKALAAALLAGALLATAVPEPPTVAAAPALAAAWRMLAALGASALGPGAGRNGSGHP